MIWLYNIIIFIYIYDNNNNNNNMVIRLYNYYDNNMVI